MSKLTFCPNCNDDRLTRHDHETGSVICTECYAVLEQNQMVSDVTFVEGAGGRKGVIGQIVRIRQGEDHFDWAGREALIANVTENMRTLAEQVNVRDADTLDLGVRVYKMALERKFVRGRPRDICVAISLYAACRMQRRPVMIIDFSELLKKDLFLIGHTFLQLAFTLDFKLPIVDPALYLERFASQLDFGDKFAPVVRTAAKLASRMNRDWMVQGRRPAGISAAALIVSARIHGFNRSTEEVMTVVRLSSSTIQKRLDEFARTSIASLTPEQFDVKSEVVKEESEPPAYTAGAARRRRRRRELKRYELTREAELDALKNGKGEESEFDKEAKMEEDSASDTDDDDNASKQEGYLEDMLRREDELAHAKREVNDDEVKSQQTEVIEVDEDDIAEVNALFDNDAEINELEDDFQPDEETELFKHRFKFKSAPLPDPWILSTQEVEEDVDISDDEEIEKMLASDTEFRLRKRIWNEHFGNIYKELKRKRREQAILDEGREAKRKKKIDDGETVRQGLWDQDTPQESLREMIAGGRRNLSSASKLGMFQGDNAFDLFSMSPERDGQSQTQRASSSGGKKGIDIDDNIEFVEDGW